MGPVPFALTCGSRSTKGIEHGPGWAPDHGVVTLLFFQKPDIHEVSYN